MTMITEENKQEATSESVMRDNKIMSIIISDSGAIETKFDGNFSSHEAFGALYATLADLTVKTFVHPPLSEILQANKQSEMNILSLLKSTLEAMSSGQAQAPSNALAGDIQELIAKHSQG